MVVAWLVLVSTFSARPTRGSGSDELVVSDSVLLLAVSPAHQEAPVLGVSGQDVAPAVLTPDVSHHRAWA